MNESNNKIKGNCILFSTVVLDSSEVPVVLRIPGDPVVLLLDSPVRPVLDEASEEEVVVALT
jgi:hypothetical protein